MYHDDFFCFGSCIIYRDGGRSRIIFRILTLFIGIEIRSWYVVICIPWIFFWQQTWANGDVMNALGFGVIKVGGTKVLSGGFDTDLEFRRNCLTFWWSGMSMVGGNVVWAGNSDWKFSKIGVLCVWGSSYFCNNQLRWNIYLYYCYFIVDEISYTFGIRVEYI